VGERTHRPPAPIESVARGTAYAKSECLKAPHETRLQLERGARFVHERVQLRLVVIVCIARSLTFDSLELVQLMLHSTAVQ
jgi:hypothetical protein